LVGSRELSDDQAKERRSVGQSKILQEAEEQMPDSNTVVADVVPRLNRTLEHVLGLNCELHLPGSGI